MTVAHAELLQVASSLLSQSPANSNSLRGVKAGTRTIDEVSRLEALLRDVEDPSSMSPELLERAIKAGLWYHVNPFRGALIRSLEIPAGARILEVGCGAGALTRVLGEKGFKVVALEASEELAECARVRCNDLPNVEIVTGYVEQVVHDQRFDFIICIDPVLPESEFYDPGLQLFSLCRKVLKSTGSLVMSVGNPLHAPGGVHIEPSREHVRGRGASLEALKQSLSSAGFTHCENYMTFPNHAAPQLVVNPDEARRERVFWLSILKELYASSEVADGEMERWWRGIYFEGLERSLAPGWLLVAHAHHVHSVLWNGSPVKRYIPMNSDASPSESQNEKGIGIHAIPVPNQNLIELILNASKPIVNSVKDYKDSLVNADMRIDELALKESAARNKLQDAHDALVRAEDRHTTELYTERESRRVREAELGLVLKQYHAVGAMCHDMREEGRKLKEMLEELRRRYVASEEWGSALAKRISETEAELHEARASLPFRLMQRIKGFFNKTSPRDVALESARK